MNHAYRLVWNERRQRHVPAPESARARSKAGGKSVLKPAAALIAAAFALPAHALAPDALPTGGQVAAGQAGIHQNGAQMTVAQGSDKAILHWQGFDIGSQAVVHFEQPSASAVALNRVLAGDASRIHGRLTANGQVWLINPAGVVFGPGSRVDVGGLVASTLDIADEDFLDGKARFDRNGAIGAIINRGELTAADGGLVALLAPTVINEGVISARLGDVALAAGERITLEAGADGRLQVAVEAATLRTLIDNRQLIVADGGQVVMTGRAAAELSASVVANHGTVQARTLAEREGRILLLADMEHGEVRHAGLLDASAPDGGDGGFVETSAAKVSIGQYDDDNDDNDATVARVTTKAENGRTGTWLIDPNDYTIAASGGDITGAQLSSDLASTNVEIQSSAGGQVGNGDIHVNDAVGWSANTLTLTAARDININAVMTASGSSQLVMNTGTANGGDGAVAGGRVRVGLAPGAPSGFAGRVDFPDRSGTGFLTINGSGYYVLGANDLGVAGDATTTSLQGIRNNLGGKYALGADIDASATASWNSGAGFMRIGENYPSFTGHLDGLGHVVDGLYINQPGVNFVGMFGSTRDGAVIRNIGMTNANVAAQSYVGALLGQIIGNGQFHNIHSSGTVQGSSSGAAGLIGGGSVYGSLYIDHVFSSATVSANYYAAGIVGYLSVHGPAVIEHAGATGTISSNGAGGLLGNITIYGTTLDLRNLYSTATVVTADSQSGSLAGSIYSRDEAITTLQNSYASGSAPNLFGRASTYAGTLTFSGVFWDKTQAPGFAGYTNVSSAGVVGLTTAQMRTLANFNSATTANGSINPDWDISGDAGDTTIWRIYDGQSYPLLRAWQTTPVVTANDAGKVYDGDTWSDGNGYSGAPVTGTPAWGGDSQGAKNAGSYAITISGLSLDRSTQQDYQFWNDDPIVYRDGALTVTPKVLDAGLTAENKVYDGTAAATLDGSAVLSGVIGGDDVSLSGSVDSSVFEDANAGAGKTVIVGGLTLDGDDKGNYTLGLPDALTLTADITPKPLIVTGTTVDDKLYDGTTAASVTPGALSDFVGSETVTIALASGVFDDVNASATPYGVEVSYVLADGTNGGLASNYTLADTNHSATISKADLSISAKSDLTKTYGDTYAFTAGDLTVTGLKNGETIGSVDLASAGAAATAGVNGGTPYTVMVSNAAGGTFSAGNYTITYSNGELTITPRLITVTAQAQSRHYGDANPTTGAVAVTSGSLANDDALGTATLAAAGSATAAANAGTTHALTPSAQTFTAGSAGNYTITYSNGELTITQRPITVTAQAQSRHYGDANPASGGVSLTAGTLANDDALGNASLAAAATATSNAGTTHALTPSAQAFTAGSVGNYAITYADGVLTITQRPITVTAQAQSRHYGDANPASGGVSLTAGTLANDDALGNASLAAAATATSNAGSSHALTPSVQTFTAGSAGNYAITYADGVLTITQRPITVTAQAQSRHYGDANPASGGVSLTAGTLANDDALGNASLAAAATATSNAGSTHALTPSAQTFTAGSVGNYAITYADGVLTITQRPITVTAQAQSRHYGDANPASGGVSLTAGTLANDDALGNASLAAAATATSNAGSSHALTPSVQTFTAGSAGNYAITYADGTLTITPAPLAITANDASKTLGATVTFAGTEFTVSGLKNGETVGHVDLASAGAGVAADVAGSPYIISVGNAGGGTFDVGNYAIIYQDGHLVVTAPSGASSFGARVAAIADRALAGADQPADTGGADDAAALSAFAGAPMLAASDPAGQIVGSGVPFLAHKGEFIPIE